MDTALWELYEALTLYLTQHYDTALLVAHLGGLNGTNLTRGNRTLDHYYTQFKESYKAQSRPLCGKLDHAAVFLMPRYKQWLKHVQAQL